MASASTLDYISTLNGLIQIDKDSEVGFGKAAEYARRPDLKQLFSEYAQQREQFAAELQAIVARLGSDPDRTGSVSGTLHRAWMDLKTKLTNKEDAIIFDHAILEEAERGEDTAVEAYQNALQASFPTDIRAILERQYQLIQQAHRNVRNLRNTIGTAADPARNRQPAKTM